MNEANNQAGQAHAQGGSGFQAQAQPGGGQGWMGGHHGQAYFYSPAPEPMNTAPPQYAPYMAAHPGYVPPPYYAAPAQHAPYMAPHPGYLHPQQQAQYGGAAGYHAPAPQYAAPAYGYGYPPPQAQHDSHSGVGSFFDFRDERFVKGALTGAALTFVLTNESFQKNSLKSILKLWHMLQGGVEEMKERIQDLDAEIKAESQTKSGG